MVIAIHDYSTLLVTILLTFWNGYIPALSILDCKTMAPTFQPAQKEVVQVLMTFQGIDMKGSLGTTFLNFIFSELACTW